MWIPVWKVKVFNIQVLGVKVNQQIVHGTVDDSGSFCHGAHDCSSTATSCNSWIRRARRSAEVVWPHFFEDKSKYCNRSQIWLQDATVVDVKRSYILVLYDVLPFWRLDFDCLYPSLLWLWIPCLSCLWRNETQWSPGFFCVRHWLVPVGSTIVSLSPKP